MRSAHQSLKDDTKNQTTSGVPVHQQSRSKWKKLELEVSVAAVGLEPTTYGL
jgi:hypothetical protein